MKKFVYMILVACLVAAPAAVGAQADDGVVTTPPLTEAQAISQANAINAYWTPERMAEAIPMPTPTVMVTEDDFERQATDSFEIDGPPGLVNGHPPGGAPYVPFVQTFAQSDAAPMSTADTQDYGTAPTNPEDGPYGPFQRYTMHGKYLNWPRSVHGKLFFTLNGSNFVCSATVIGRSTVATAGHCISDGDGNFASSVTFCPSYFQSGVHPNRGCWSWSTGVTTSAWHSNGDPDYDYACIVTQTTGTILSNKIGNVTGWAGRAWNWDDEEPEVIFGYPAASPFTGDIIIQTNTVDWYDWQFTSGGPSSKIVGNDMTGGSSGGGWFLSWRAPGAEIGDTDGSSATDPVCGNCGPHINGVNSHKRCTGGTCKSPPDDTSGVFWQEMTSPKFRSSSTDNQDSEDVFAVCLDHVNNER